MTAAETDDEGKKGGKGGKDADARRIRFIARALPAWLAFDGEDTIFGTPGPEDVGRHRVRLRAQVKGDRVDQDFSIDVAPAPTEVTPPAADLAASISVDSQTVPVGSSLSWRVTARNLADADVANYVLETEFSGDAAFRIDAADDPACSIEPRGEQTSVVCRWAPLEKGRSKAARISGRATGPGEIVATARVSIVDPVPKDRNPANDAAKVSVSVTENEVPDADRDGPTLTLAGSSTITVTVGGAFDDPGATAVDDVDGDLTRMIVVDNPVDTKVIGRYSVTYEVTDSAGNVTTATRTVEVVPLPPGGGGGGGAVGLAMLIPLAVAAALRRRYGVATRPASE